MSFIYNLSYLKVLRFYYAEIRAKHRRFDEFECACNEDYCRAQGGAVNKGWSGDLKLLKLNICPIYKCFLQPVSSPSLVRSSVMRADTRAAILADVEKLKADLDQIIVSSQRRSSDGGVSKVGFH
jgi:hypothetical protein